MVKVEQLMMKNLIYITKDCTVEKAGQLMVHHKIDCLPIVDSTHKILALITMHDVLHVFLNGDGRNRKAADISREDFFTINPNTEIVKVAELPYESYPVVDADGKLVGFLARQDVVRALADDVQTLDDVENSAAILSSILESAYEGIAVVDQNGILVEFNEAYSRFTGINRSDAIGSHVTEVIENTNLHETVKTAIPDRGVLQNIQGQDMVVHRIPIWKDEKVIGAIGMLIFEGVSEVYRIYERLQTEKMINLGMNEGMSAPQKTDSMTMDQIIGVSEVTSNLKQLTRKAAQTKATVLISGERGTGKEMYARSIHELSPFAKGRFTRVNCDMPEADLEMELFGGDGRQGELATAESGTLYLDEIDKLPKALQIKLLRVLKDRKVEIPGSKQTCSLQIRFIAASRLDLRELVAENQFYRDLYDRLSIIHLVIPPLRKRIEDIPLLLSYYVKEMCYYHQIPRKTFTSETVKALIGHPWHGNVEEMVTVLERIVSVVNDRVIGMEHLPETISSRAAAETDGTDDIFDSTNLMEQMKDKRDKRERQVILEILDKAGGNKSKAANLLGIHRTTLYKKLKRYKINA